MGNQESGKHGKRLNPLLIVGLAVALWGLLGLSQARNSGHGGYRTSWGGEVSEVEENGPAENAGLEVGDIIASVGGTPIDDPWIKPYQGRVGIGQTQSLGVERGGERADIEIEWEALTQDHWRSRIVQALVTLAFLGFGLWALFSTGTRAGLLLALFGICYGAAAFEGPTLGIPAGVVAFLQSNLSLLITVLLFHFLTIFPKPKWILRWRKAEWVLYAPFLLFLIFGFAEVFLFPSALAEYASSAMWTDILYMLLALAALIHSWISLSRHERRESGFNRILLGLLIAFGPILILELIKLALPGFNLPGEGNLTLLGVAIPAGLALAVKKGSRVPG